MRVLRLALPRLFAIGVIASLLCYCSGSSSNQVSSEPSDSAFSPDFLGPPPALQPLPVDLSLNEPLDSAFDRVRQVYSDAGIETFDARRGFATSPAANFAWYFTVNDPNDPFARTNHVFFVVTGAWDENRTRAFLLSYLVMPGAPVSETGRHWFHFYSVETPPFAVRYLFSNSAQGAIESALLTELGTARWNPADMDMVARRAGEILTRFGLESPVLDADTCPSELDVLYSSLGRPPAGERDDTFGQRFLPEATLATIGLFIGEFLRRQTTEPTFWETDDESIYPRLRVDSAQPGVLRPIQMTIELYLADANVLPSDYCNRMLHNLINAGAADVPLGDD